MDFEEEWRAAMMEAAAPQPPQRPLTSANPPAQKDVYDEFSDDDLMQSLPFANDTAPAFSTEPILLPSALLLSSAGGTNAPSGTSTAASAPRRTLMKAGAATSTPLSATAAAAQPACSAATPPAPATSAAATSTTRPARKEPQRGVLNFPPAHGASFLLRGDDGRVRWVTAEGGAMMRKRSTTAATTSRTAAATDGPARGRASRRKRTRTASPTINRSDAVVVIGDDEESNMEDGGVGAEGTTRREAEVVDVDSAASDDCANSTSGSASDADSDVGIEDASPSSLSAAADGVSQGRGDEAHQDNGIDDEDDDDGDEDEGGRGLRQAPAFLRDGLHVRDLMQSMYAEDAERESKQKAAAQQRRYRDEDGDGLHPSDPFATPQRRSLDVAATPQSGVTAPPTRAARLQGSGELWVTKYSPKLFREVLSDESINLQLLQWLKSWDAYVFPEQQQQQQLAAAGSAAGQALKGSVSGPLAAGGSGAAVAAAAPPDERIAVLTGPPGVGKTTLVHVLAAHCGYEVIEVNASVERTASRLEALIKTAVSAAGPAPGGRLRRPVNTTASMPGRRVESGHGDRHDDDRGEAAAERSGGATSLVQHLLRPKCLVIDEMDGIASSSVATYLIQQQLHRPVFCLCNDLYVPSLRPLRQRCSHVFYMPPIRSQRLLARLEDIARRERVTGLDSMALSELITVSGGDVRSCLNTMQFIHSVLTQQQQQNGEAGTGAAVPTQRHTVTELIRRMQGKDTRVVLKDTWQMLFARPERNKAVQMLKQECGVDYEALVEAAAAQNHRQHERDRARGQPACAESTGPASALHGSGAGEQEVDAAPGPHRRPRLEVAKGFRVDPGYLFAAHQLARCPDTAGLLDGLQENYLDRAYTDYTFARTSATAACFSQQDMIVTASFQHPELMGAAERMGQVSALTCYVHCSTAARGGRIEFPREQATLRRLQSESQHVSQQLRDGCRPQLALFLGGEEATSTETAPMLLRCLVDRTLRLPAHAIASFSRLPAVDQALLQASVARHVEYGLDYERDRQYTPSAQSQFFGGAAGGRPHSLFSSNAEVDDVPWRLTPQLDRLVAGVVRPMETALSGGRGGGGGGNAPYARGRFGERGAHPGGGGGARGGLGATAAAAAGRPSLSSVMMPLKNEVRQILVGEIRQYRIMQSVEFLKRQQQSAAAAGTAKRPRDDEEEDATTTTSTATAAANGGATPASACSPAPEPPTAPANAASLTQLRETESNAKTEGGAGESGTAAARSLPDAKRRRADQNGKEAEEGNVEDATPTTTAAAAAAVASPTTRTQAVRRDFFGRPIPDTAAAAASAGRRGRSANTAATTPSTASPSPPGVSGGGGGGGFPRSQPPNVPPMQASVKYVYQDGATNAVKMPAVFADF